MFLAAVSKTALEIKGTSSRCRSELLQCGLQMGQLTLPRQDGSRRHGSKVCGGKRPRGGKGPRGGKEGSSWGLLECYRLRGESTRCTEGAFTSQVFFILPIIVTFQAQ